MRHHLERALALATERGSPAGRAEVLALLATEAARLGADQNDDDLLGHAAAWGEEAIRMGRALPASDAWFEAYGLAALAQVALARGDRDAALEHALGAIAEMRRTRQLFTFLFPELRLLIARATAGVEDPRVAEFVMQARGDIILATFESNDDEFRARWMRTKIMSELAALVGADEAVRTLPSGASVPAELSEEEIDVLRRIMSGQSNREIGRALEHDEAEVTALIDRVFTALGATTRSQASVAALRKGLV
jgi:DNA-binding CsgD family transcriptional regulator